MKREVIANKSEVRARVYDATVHLLQDKDRDTKVGGKNWGEIVSLAAAKAMDSPSCCLMKETSKK